MAMAQQQTTTKDQATGLEINTTPKACIAITNLIRIRSDNIYEFKIKTMLVTPRIENVNEGQMYLVIEKSNGEEFYKKVYRDYDEAKQYFNTLF